MNNPYEDQDYEKLNDEYKTYEDAEPDDFGKTSIEEMKELGRRLDALMDKIKRNHTI